MKNIFKEEMPSHLYIQNGEISEKAPEKILKEKTPNLSLLDSLHYDNTPPIDSKGNEVIYDNKKHHLDSQQYQHQKAGRKKKTAINSGDTSLLEKARETTNKENSRGFWDIIPYSKKIYFYGGRSYCCIRTSCQLQETGIFYECMAEYHL